MRLRRSVRRYSASRSSAPRRSARRSVCSEHCQRANRWHSTPSCQARPHQPPSGRTSMTRHGRRSLGRESPWCRGCPSRGCSASRATLQQKAPAGRSPGWPADLCSSLTVARNICPHTQATVPGPVWDSRPTSKVIDSCVVRYLLCARCESEQEAERTLAGRPDQQSERNWPKRSLLARSSRQDAAARISQTSSEIQPLGDEVDSTSLSADTAPVSTTRRSSAASQLS